MNNLTQRLRARPLSSYYMADMVQAADKIEELEKKLQSCEQSYADLKKTLDEAVRVAEFYGNEKNWECLMGYVSPKTIIVTEDVGGKTARQFLKSLEDDNESKN